MTDIEQIKILQAKNEDNLSKANQVYNEILAENQNLNAQQDETIKNYINDTTNNINQSVANNISQIESNITSANNLYNQEVENSKKAYNDYISIPIDETNRIKANSAYKNRISSANKTLDSTIQEYNNQIKYAKLTGDINIANNAKALLEEQYNLYKSSLKYQNSLKQNQLENENNLSNEYWNRRKNIISAVNDINSINTEKSQFNETLAYQKEQDSIKNSLAEKEYRLDLKNAKKSSSSSSGSSKSYAITDTSTSNKSSSGYGSIAESEGWSKNAVSVSPNNVTTSASKYGTFSNGYQPKGISGYGKLTKSGHTCTVNGKEQNIWLTTSSDGTKKAWYWDGKNKAYIGISW